MQSRNLSVLFSLVALVALGLSLPSQAAETLNRRLEISMQWDSFGQGRFFKDPAVSLALDQEEIPMEAQILKQWHGQYVKTFEKDGIRLKIKVDLRKELYRGGTTRYVLWIWQGNDIIATLYVPTLADLQKISLQTVRGIPLVDGQGKEVVPTLHWYAR